QPDDLAAHHANPVAFGLAPHRLEDQVHRGLLEIGEIDRHLREIARPEHHAHRLHVTEASVGETDGFGDALRDRNIRRVEIDVVSDQEFAGAGDESARTWMTDRVADVGRSRLHDAHLLHQGFELALANIFQIGAFGPLCGGLVEIDGNVKLAPYFLPEALGELYAFFEGDAFDGNERHDVGRAEAWMRSLMLAEVDERGGFLDRAKCRGGYSSRRADKREHAAIVIGVAFAIEEDHIGQAGDGLYDGVDLGHVAAFTEVGNTLYELSGHVSLM